ncbi:MAG: tetratricopeptide repeat protein, partial [Bacteroidota bacterium]
YENALDCHQKALECRQELGDRSGTANSYNNLGIIYNTIGDYEKALEMNLKALGIREAIDEKRGIADSYANIGMVYLNLANYDKALEFLLKGLAVYEELNDKPRKASMLANIGIIYSNQKNYRKAIENYETAIAAFKEIDNKNWVAYCYNNIGTVYFYQNDYEKALSSFFESKKIREDIGDKQGLAVVYNNIGEVYARQNKLGDSFDNLMTSLSISRAINYRDGIKDTYKSLSELFEKRANYRLAHEYFKKYSELKDSLLNEKVTKQVSEMNIKYDTEKKQKKIELLNKEKEKQAAIASAENKRKNTIISAITGGALLILVFSVFLFNRFQVIRKQRNIITEKNKEITDSITYAKRIQEAILPLEDSFRKLFPESFILYRPKDIVSGDFYWLAEKNNKIIFAVVDCTGHGVPGAFMSLIGFSLLNQIVKEQNITTPAEILKELSKGINLSFKQNELSEVKDSMDIAICSFDKEKNSLEYAGAYRPLFYFKQSQFHETKSDKKAIGDFDEYTSYTNHKLELQRGDSIYIFSDGYTDQFGGEKGKKFKNKQFEDKLLAIQSKSMSEQKKILEETFLSWKGSLEQIDDILIIGVRISNNE